MGPRSERKIDSKACQRQTLLGGMLECFPEIFENDGCFNCFCGYFGC